MSGTSPIVQFRELVTAWCAATGSKYGGLSARLFNRDGSRLGKIMAGADLTTTAHWNALRWFSENWPDGTDWPEGVERPGAALVIGVDGGVAAPAEDEAAA